MAVDFLTGINVNGGDIEIVNDFASLVLDSTTIYGSANGIFSKRNGASSPVQGSLTWLTGQYGGGSKWSTRITGAPYTTSYINLPHDSSGGNFSINIENNERLTIDRSNGNVGIGVTSPETALHVVQQNVGVKGVYTTCLIEAEDSALDINSNNAGLWGSAINLVEGNGSSNTNTWSIARRTSTSDNSLKFNFGTVNSHLNSNKITFTSDARVGIGVESPTAALEVEGVIVSNGGSYPSAASTLSDVGYVIKQSDKLYSTVPHNGSTYLRNLIGMDSSKNINIGEGGTGIVGDIFFLPGSNGNVIFKTQSDAETMRVNSSGNVGIGVTSPAVKLEVNGAIRAGSGPSNGLEINTGYGIHGIKSYYGSLYTTANVYIGGVNGIAYKTIAASAFNVNSDYRLKTNITPLSNSVEKVKQLKVHRFNWKDRLEEDKIDGFLAHEVTSVVPEAVTGSKDAVREDGTEEYQQIDQSKLVPLLTAALKEAIDKIEKLEVRIQTLENK